MSYVLGVDGGNTKTIALVADATGQIVGAGRGGCGDIYSIDPASVSIPGVVAAVEAALAQCGLAPGSIASALFSMAGADWPEDFAHIHTLLAHSGFGGRITVVNDALGALRAGSPDGLGVVVVCGTGTATGARGLTGQVWHSSFWQEPQGADQLGQKTLWAIYRAALGIDGPTLLSNHVPAFFGLPDAEAVLQRFTARTARVRDQHRLAPVLLDVAAAGDATARRIVLEHGSALGEVALVAAHKVGLRNQPFSLVLAGGVLRHASPLLSDALLARVRQQAPDVRVYYSRYEPAVGALLLALEAAGVPTDAALLARMEATLPPAALFATRA